MRLLDPFAGYNLANGIAIFHVALFISSFWVDWSSSQVDSVDDLNLSGYDDTEIVSTAETLSSQLNDSDIAFWTMRWAHIVVASLTGIAMWADQDSKISDKEIEEVQKKSKPNA